LRWVGKPQRNGVRNALISTDSKQLHTKAQLYLKAAMSAKDEESREAYLRLMAAWREIARQTKRTERDAA
jgi:hypothetical protein